MFLPLEQCVDIFVYCTLAYMNLAATIEVAMRPAPHRLSLIKFTSDHQVSAGDPMRPPEQHSKRLIIGITRALGLTCSSDACRH